MAHILASLFDSSKWELAYQETKEAIRIGETGKYTPLPAFEVPILLSSRLLMVKTVSDIPVKKFWKWAGDFRIYQTFPVGGITPQKTEVDKYPLALNRSKLIVLPNFASGYATELSGAFWLTNLQLTIYEFTGDATTAIDLLQVQQTDINTIKNDTSNLIELIGG